MAQIFNTGETVSVWRKDRRKSNYDMLSRTINNSSITLNEKGALCIVHKDKTILEVQKGSVTFRKENFKDYTYSNQAEIINLIKDVLIDFFKIKVNSVWEQTNIDIIRLEAMLREYDVYML